MLAATAKSERKNAWHNSKEETEREQKKVQKIPHYLLA